MARILIVYASMSGCTEEMTDLIAQGIRAYGIDVDIHDVFDTEAAELADYDGILLGSHTWDDGLPDEYLDFYEEMDELDLTGKNAAVFGSCDSTYAMYG